VTFNPSNPNKHNLSTFVSRFHAQFYQTKTTTTANENTKLTRIFVSEINNTIGEEKELEREPVMLYIQVSVHTHVCVCASVCMYACVCVLERIFSFHDDRLSEKTKMLFVRVEKNEENRCCRNSAAFCSESDKTTKAHIETAVMWRRQVNFCLGFSRFRIVTRTAQATDRIQKKQKEG